MGGLNALNDKEIIEIIHFVNIIFNQHYFKYDNKSIFRNLILFYYKIIFRYEIYKEETIQVFNHIACFFRIDFSFH